LADDPAGKLAQAALNNYVGVDLTKIRPVFVSRAPKRLGTGALHKETISSARYIDQGKSCVRTPLSKLKLKDLASLVGADDPRNKIFYDALRQRLEQYGGDGKKAFVEPFFKPGKEGSPTVRVRTVKLLTTQKDGVEVRQGIADNGEMVRVDVFAKNGKFYTVPIYPDDRCRPQLPDRAVKSGGSREEWIRIDSSYQFLFSLHINDVVRFQKEDCSQLGYFAGLDVNGERIKIRAHDNKANLERYTVKTAAVIEKLHVDPLGRLYKVQKEVRRALA
jgi:CRISPR-associated endonuclease Csn1